MGKIVFFLLVFLFIACHPTTPTIPQQNLFYFKGKFSLQSEKKNFLGSVEIASSEKIFSLQAKDSFFRPVLEIRLTKKNIFIIENKNKYSFKNNKNNRKKYLGINLDILDFQQIFRYQAKAKTTDFIFFGSFPMPDYAIKKEKNNSIRVDYYDWEQKGSDYFPKNLLIRSQNPELSIRLVAKSVEMIKTY